MQIIRRNRRPLNPYVLLKGQPLAKYVFRLTCRVGRSIINSNVFRVQVNIFKFRRFLQIEKGIASDNL